MAYRHRCENLYWFVQLAWLHQSVLLSAENEASSACNNPCGFRLRQQIGLLNIQNRSTERAALVGDHLRVFGAML